MTAFSGRPLQDPLFPRPLNFPFPVLVLLMALAVSGCGLMPEGEAASPAAAPPGNPQAPPGLAVARVSPPSAAVPAPAPAPSAAVPAPAPPEPARPEKTYPEPAHLSGLDGSRILALLGVPNLKRQDDPAEIWQYQTPACTLHLFLYRTAKGKDYTVRHFETRARGKDGVSEKACFTGLLKAHERGQAG